MGKLDNVKAFVKDNKSDILIGGGIVAGILSATLLVCSTIKAVEEYKEHKDNIETCKTIETVPDENGTDVAVTDEQRKKYIRNENLQYAWNLTKLYALPVIGGVVSVGAILAAHKIDKNQKNEALALATEAVAAASSIAASFAEYRKRVVDRYGAQVDYDIYMGRSEVEVITEEVDPKTGKKKQVKKTVVTYDPIDADIYKREFGPYTSNSWTKNPHRNFIAMTSWAKAINEQIACRGYGIVNDLYQHFGFDTTVGPDQTEPFVPNSIGWVGPKILDLLPDEWDWKGRHYIKSEYATVVDLGITDVRMDQYKYDLDHECSDDVWIIRPNCYPIDSILEFAHHYFKTQKKSKLAVDRMVLDELGKTEFFNI